MFQNSHHLTKTLEYAIYDIMDVENFQSEAEYIMYFSPQMANPRISPVHTQRAYLMTYLVPTESFTLFL